MKGPEGVVVWEGRWGNLARAVKAPQTVLTDRLRGGENQSGEPGATLLTPRKKPAPRRGIFSPNDRK